MINIAPELIVFQSFLLYSLACALGAGLLLILIQYLGGE